MFHVSMEQRCDITGESFSISSAELEYCRRNDVPLPTITPFERLRSLFIFRNRLHLVRATCDFTGEAILSCIPPESGHSIYDSEIWESDQWDSLTYGRDYDFSRPFFAQFRDLFLDVPMPNLSVVRSTMENSDYTNGITAAKNCYLVFASSFNEDCLFSFYLVRSVNLVDCLNAIDSELCYDCRDIIRCYNLKFSDHCNNCSDSNFLAHCHGCKNCYGCVNLVQREYCFFNEQLSREDYEKRLVEIDLGNYEMLCAERVRFADFRKGFPIRAYLGTNNENSTGHFVSNTKNCHNVFLLSDAEDVEYSIGLDSAKSCFFQASFGNQSELIYNCVTCGDSAYNLRFCGNCWQGARDLEYCMFTGFGSRNCFACVGLKHAEYCVLNKPYSKSDYLDLVQRIKAQMRANGEYGRFFPIELSPHPYNRSDVQYYFPLEREEALQRGYLWDDTEEESSTESFPIPLHIDDVKDDILQRSLVCEQTGKSYKLVKAELDYYRQHKIPIPRVAPLERIKARARLLEMKPLRELPCVKCGNAMQTVFNTERNTVLCESCFREQVF